MKIVISHTSNIPIYRQIAAQIKNSIIKGELAKNEALPSIRKLAKELHISVITTKKAYEELEKEGYIVTIPGKGCYVAAHNREALREKRSKLALVEKKLADAVMTAKSLNLTLEELQKMLEIIFEEA